MRPKDAFCIIIHIYILYDQQIALCDLFYFSYFCIISNLNQNLDIVEIIGLFVAYHGKSFKNTLQ